MNALDTFTKKTASLVGWLLLVSALLFYAYGIIEAIAQTLSPPAGGISYPGFLATTISSIQALLLTNLGVVLGISLTRPQSTIASAIRLKSSAVAVDTPAEWRDRIQLFAVIVYILSLIACLITWAVKEFDSDETQMVPVILESAKMFTGVVLGYIAMLLTKPE